VTGPQEPEAACGHLDAEDYRELARALRGIHRRFEEAQRRRRHAARDRQAQQEGEPREGQ
jgi:hypothetical protein